jgi:hypothetical protein|tara:strand:- start:189 stop:674 length:486 start_codon:yes stop_codon:yes gene_type:complete
MKNQNRFEAFHKSLMELSETGAKHNVTLSKIVKSPTESTAYCQWLTLYAWNEGVSNPDIMQSIKKFQNRLNKTATQRLCFALKDKDELTHKKRLVKANKKDASDGHFTSAELEMRPRPYKFLVRENDVKVATFIEKLQKLVTSHSLTKAQLDKQLTNLKFG